MKKILLILSLLFSFNALAARERVYNLEVQNATVNITGKEVKHALAINGQMPAPLLKFKLGDMAVINVKNSTDEPTTLHWHGVLVPWNMDGPSFSNNKLILPGETFQFRFPIKHTGTYWYHSHTELQEQRGLYGPIVIEEENDDHVVDYDEVIVMSDWIDEKPKQVLYNLKKDGDYYAYKKEFLPSVLGAIRAGKIWNYLKSEWTRMGPMDLSDVAYDAFLINGKTKSHFMKAKPGDKIRLRVINASASTYFYFNIGKLRNFKVVSKDGMPVVPVVVNELLVGIAETYDVIFEVPEEEGKSFELRATAQDITGAATMMIGKGKMEMVPMKMKPSPYGGHSDHGGGGGSGGGHDDHGGMNHDDMADDFFADDEMMVDMEMPMPMMKTNRLMYKMLKSPTMTHFNPEWPRRKIELQLSGDMERYTWHINGKTFSEDKYIMIKYGEVVQITFKNKTMMHHPMHLHGHFFRVINGQGHKSPLMHTVDVAPMAEVKIEFYANEPGIWFLHCHNLYHMKMGMARLVKYQGFERPIELEEHEREWAPQMTHDNSAFFGGELGVFSNHLELGVRINAGRYEIELDLEVDEYDLDTLEANLLFKRYLNKYLATMTGVEFEDSRLHALLGVAYTLPFNVEMLGYVRSDGKVKIKLRKEIPVTSRLLLELAPELSYLEEFDFEFEASLMYRLSQRWRAGIRYKYDSDDGHSIGIGVTLTF